MIQIKQNNSGNAVIMFDGTFAITFPNDEVESLSQEIKDAVIELTSLDGERSPDVVTVDSERGQQLFDWLTSQLSKFTTVGTPIEFKTKGGLIDKLEEQGVTGYDDLIEMEELRLILVEPCNEGLDIQWNRDMLNVLSVEQLVELENYRVPEILDEGAVAAKHFIAEKEDYDANGDLRGRVAGLLNVDVECLDERPSKFGRIYCEWFHYDLEAELTEETFQEKLTSAVEAFAKQLNEHANPLRTVRFNHFPPTQFGTGYLDWSGDEFPFDLRVIVQFGNFAIPDSEATSPGLHFFLTTLVDWDDEAFADCEKC